MNRLQPELTLTDPVKLERRLKRQRGEDVSDLHRSEAEAHFVNGGRDAKQLRLVDEYNDDHDPLDTVGSSRLGMATRPPVVRSPEFTIVVQ